MTERSLGERATVGLLTRVGSRFVPMDDELMAAIVDQYGPNRSLKFFITDVPAYKKVMGAWGPIRTHFLAAAISVVNDCQWCAYEHGYAFQLHYFRTSGNIFFIDEVRMTAAAANGRAKAIETFKKSLIESGLHDEVETLERLFHVADEGPDGSEKDRYLQQLLEVIGFLNACAVRPDYRPTAAYDPITEDIELRAKYIQARQHFV